MREQTVRKVWLSILIFIPIFYLTMSILFLNNFDIKIPPTLGGCSTGSFSKMSSSLIEAFLCSFLGIPLFYFCSYKRRGTHLLSVSIYGGWIFLIGSLVFRLPQDIKFMVAAKALLSTPLALNQAADLKRITAFLIFLGIYKSLELTLSVFWLLFCQKLKKWNLKNHLQNVLNNETYRNLFEKIDEFSDFKELNLFYSKSIQSNPEIEKLLTQRYKQRKKMLNC